MVTLRRSRRLCRRDRSRTISLSGRPAGGNQQEGVNDDDSVSVSVRSRLVGCRSRRISERSCPSHARTWPPAIRRSASRILPNAQELEDFQRMTSAPQGKESLWVGVDAVAQQGEGVTTHHGLCTQAPVELFESRHGIDGIPHRRVLRLPGRANRSSEDFARMYGDAKGTAHSRRANPTVLLAKWGKDLAPQQLDGAQRIGAERRPEREVAHAGRDERAQAIDQRGGPAGHADAQHALVHHRARAIEVALDRAARARSARSPRGRRRDARRSAGRERGRSRRSSRPARAGRRPRRRPARPRCTRRGRAGRVPGRGAGTALVDQRAHRGPVLGREEQGQRAVGQLAGQPQHRRAPSRPGRSASRGAG